MFSFCSARGRDKVEVGSDVTAGRNPRSLLPTGRATQSVCSACLNRSSLHVCCLLIQFLFIYFLALWLWVMSCWTVVWSGLFTVSQYFWPSMMALKWKSNFAPVDCAAEKYSHQIETWRDFRNKRMPLVLVLMDYFSLKHADNIKGKRLDLIVFIYFSLCQQNIS